MIKIGPVDYPTRLIGYQKIDKAGEERDDVSARRREMQVLLNYEQVPGIHHLKKFPQSTNLAKGYCNV